MNPRLARVLVVTAIAAFLTPLHAAAGPPFLTDDPQPVDLHHYEIYVFGALQRTRNDTATTGPAVEFNDGVLPNVQLHIVAPYVFNATLGTPAMSGYGDTEIGVKFRFLQETKTRPQIGIFPMAEIATGDANRGLGNGQTWYKIPLWMQKSWGSWTTYGGGGTVINHAPGMENYGFGGWLLQCDFGDHLTLGAELFTQGPQTVGARGSTIFNLGGYLLPTKHFNILFSLGHTIRGDSQTVAYFGLYWTGLFQGASCCGYAERRPQPWAPSPL